MYVTNDGIYLLLYKNINIICFIMVAVVFFV